MSSEKKIAFFAELGKILNLIRSISAELNEEPCIDLSKNPALNINWYTRDSSIVRLQANLHQLESEIAFFFTDNGSRKTFENRLNTQIFRQKFIENCKLLVIGYFNIKSDLSAKKISQQNTTPSVNIDIYKRGTRPLSFMN